MQIFVRGTDGAVTIIDVGRDETVAQVVRMAAPRGWWSAGGLTTLRQDRSGRVLASHRSLADYGVSAGDELGLSLSLRGGSARKASDEGNGDSVIMGEDDGKGGLRIPWYFYAIVFGSIGCVILICLLPKKYLQRITDWLKKEQKIQEEAELERAKHSFEEQEKERRNNPVADGIKDGTICENCEWRPAATEGEAAGYGMCQKCWDADGEDVDTTSRDQVDSDEERTDLEKRLDADAEDMDEAERRKEELKKQGYTSYEQFDKRIK